MLRPRFRTLKPGEKQKLAHWAMELAVVVVGVLLALWATEWVTARREARLHAETLAQVDAAIERTLAVSAVRVAMADCLRNRIGELDAALLAGEGEWKAMPLDGLPPQLTRYRHNPFTFLADGIDVPVSLFELAEDNGTMAALSPEERRYYEAARQDLVWIDDNWRDGWTEVSPLALLGRDGQLDAAARYDMRKLLTLFDTENHVAVVRAGSLARLVAERGVEPSDIRRDLYADRMSRARERMGGCVTDVDLVTLEPIR